MKTKMTMRWDLVLTPHHSLWSVTRGQNRLICCSGMVLKLWDQREIGCLSPPARPRAAGRPITLCASLRKPRDHDQAVEILVARGGPLPDREPMDGWYLLPLDLGGDPKRRRDWNTGLTAIDDMLDSWLGRRRKKPVKLYVWLLELLPPSLGDEVYA